MAKKRSSKKTENDKSIISLENNKALLTTIKENLKLQKKMTKACSKRILKGEIISTLGYKPDLKKFIIELHNVEKSYVMGEIEYKVLKGIDLKISCGEFVVILGPSGSGKTTLLNIISGLDKASTGDVFVDGHNLTLLKNRHLTDFRCNYVGFVFQNYNLLDTLSAKENAEVGENLAKNKKRVMTLEEIFASIGMSAEMDKKPSQLSGGQQQRVSIARAIAKNPSILFCDEPTGALDEEMGRKVLEILLDINKKEKTTIVTVTHNPNIAQLADIVIHVRNGIIDELKVNKDPKKPKDIKWA
ncbi:MULTISPECIES: ABC transporter ATP-binding protein [unclassified Spiroplasma]|uniref:ABC transporter ATP-binding protein n=1 Tax=unclassified Spiroplasma TaxID=2637901 RepID=UPI00313B7391